MARTKKKRNYQFYTDEQKKFLVRFAQDLGFETGTRVDDGAWDGLDKAFERRFKRKVENYLLAFQARQLCKAKTNGNGKLRR